MQFFNSFFGGVCEGICMGPRFKICPIHSLLNRKGSSIALVCLKWIFAPKILKNLKKKTSNVSSLDSNLYQG